MALFAHKQGRCRELGHFQRAVDLIVTFGDRAPGAADSVVALVTPQVGDGPFHLVVDALPPALTGPVPLWWEASRLRIGPWALVMAPRMQITSPTPCWNKLTIQPSRFRRLRDHVAVESATRRERSPVAVTMTDAVSTRTHALCRALQARDVPAIRQTAGGLAGVGVGLTPSGDDVLAGVLLALWAALGAYHAGERALLIEAICEAAVPRTTRLSRAFLEAASRGEVDVRWHRLLDALSGASDSRLDEAVHDVLAFGATSGLDMLGGFVSAFKAVRRAD